MTNTKGYEIEVENNAMRFTKRERVKLLHDDEIRHGWVKIIIYTFAEELNVRVIAECTQGVEGECWNDKKWKFEADASTMENGFEIAEIVDFEIITGPTNAWEKI